MTESDGLLVIPEIEEEYEKGKEVEIILLRPLEP
jgi:molybdopterin biosynthesis enzyme